MTFDVNPFPESLEIADYLRREASPGDTVAVIGSEPQIYFYSHLRSATGYIYTYALMESQPFAGRMQQEMIREIEAARPRYLVFVKIPSSWLIWEDSDTSIFRWYRRYAQEHYDVVGVAEILSMTRTDYFWGEDAAAHRPESPYTLTVLRRRSGA